MEDFIAHYLDYAKTTPEVPVNSGSQVRDVSGTYRTFCVPAAPKLGVKDKETGKLKRAIFWSETE